MAYSGDKYGRISAISSRGSKIEDFKKFRGYSSNETNFKEGISLLTDLEYIKVSSTAKRLEVIKAFKDRGIRRLPDGRLIDDIVVLQFPK